MHNDLKWPHFLQFGVAKTLKLIDFDHTQPVDTEMKAACTPRYAAPEVMKAVSNKQNLRCSVAADVWAMAMVLVQVFIGEPMFADEELQQLEEKLVQEMSQHMKVLQSEETALREQRNNNDPVNVKIVDIERKLRNLLYSQLHRPTALAQASMKAAQSLAPCADVTSVQGNSPAFKLQPCVF